MNGRDLLDEHVYERERAEELLAQSAKRLGLSRRRFVQALGAAAGAASVPRLAFARQGAPAAAPGEIVKPTPPELFLRSGSNAEMRWEAMYGRGTIVPNELFFVRHNSPAVPRLDPASWRLRVEGSAVGRPRSFSYDELVAMPSLSVLRAIECAGNGCRSPRPWPTTPSSSTP